LCVIVAAIKLFNSMLSFYSDLDRAWGVLFLVVFSLWTGTARANPRTPAPVSYELDLRDPGSHRVSVTMTIPDAEPSTVLQFPAWNALYQIRDFIKDVERLQATCGGEPVELTMPDSNTRRSVPKACRPLEVRYQVYADGAPPFSSGLNTAHAFLNPAMLLFYLPDQRERALRVKLLLPPGWKMATLIQGSSPDEFDAVNYDALTDSPIEAGTFEEYSYQQAGALYRVIVDDGEQPASGTEKKNPGNGRRAEGRRDGTRQYSADALVRTLEKITSLETGLMQDVPFNQYAFIIHFGVDGGGMEHAYGSAIAVSGQSARKRLAGIEWVAAHEFFHLWNVKRIRPQALEPIDYVHGNDTSDLWFAEGVTSAYGALSLLRSGLTSRSDFYAHIGGQIDSLEHRPARHFQSAEAAGRDAWLEKYPDYLRLERSISYYNKGELLGFLLDLGMRYATGNAHGLDDLMRRLNYDFARQHRFYSDDDLLNIVGELAPRFDVRRFFREYVYGTADLPYERYLAYAGLKMKQVRVEEADPGFSVERDEEGVTEVESVDSGSAADLAGLKAGDSLLEIDGRAPGETLAFSPGQEIRLKIARAVEQINLRFQIGRRSETTYRIEEIHNAAPEQLAVRRGWLQGITVTR
jgi:predicted metalloprotease with PDZ domain